MSARNRLRAAFIAFIFALALLPAAAAAQGEQQQPGKPVSELDVSLVNKKDGTQASARTDAEGNFSFGGLKPGSYKVRMACSDCQYAGRGQRSGEYVFYVSVDVAKQRKVYKTVKMMKMGAGVEYTVKVPEGAEGEISGRVTGAWDEDGEIKPPTIKPPTE
ncbi:MAG TPA: carboxypeptidase-like regulatory domain-containing protein [Pyrinomonadaceae bacterium]|nr:carboxypeptidase-like regulatory domain-containing protein [Pyrinomonadaceae bacterium]